MLSSSLLLFVLFFLDCLTNLEAILIQLLLTYEDNKLKLSFKFQDFCSRSDTVLCGVFDGHGPFGHMVAKRVRDMLPFTLSTQMKTNSETEQSYSKNGLDSATCIDGEQWCELQRNQRDEKLIPEMYPLLKRALLKTCQQMDKELKMHPTINCFCSGTTSVTVIKQVKVQSPVMYSRSVTALIVWCIPF